MSRAELKEKLFELIRKTEDQNLLEEVYEILSDWENEPDHDWWDDLTESQLVNLEKSEADIKAGRVLSHEEVKNNARKWLSK